MDVFLALILANLFALSAAASPPIDLTDFDGKGSAEAVVKGKKKSDPGIQEKEMIYVDIHDGVDSTDPGLREVKFAVIGRDRPARDGKPLVRLQAKFRVKFIKVNADKRWTMVEVVSSGKKAWVPSAALIAHEATDKPKE